jgi:hypothetical protein
VVLEADLMLVVVVLVDYCLAQHLYLQPLPILLP